MKPPEELVAAFRALVDKASEGIAMLLVDNGFDAATMRVLAAWPHLEHGWEQPKRPCPSSMPTPAAWRWLVSGHRYEAQQLADAAGVTIAIARAKATMLLGARLALPDGTITSSASAALAAHARRALGLKSKAKDKQSRGRIASDDDAN
jgi:hypothetical protein